MEGMVGIIRSISMSKLVVRAVSMSLDGFMAGAHQSLESPMGEGGMALHAWAFGTRTFQKMFGNAGGATEGLDEEFAAKSFENNGATIMGRNMFGPVRDGWGDESWKGWWGEEPPFHHPVFVLTHHARKPLVMKGGTTFHFVTEGIAAARQRALEAAGGKDVRIGGGAETIRQYLKAGLVDELHLVQAPILLGKGERIFEGLDALGGQYRCESFSASKAVVHYRLVKQ
jgi:dihydrofolate reductase